MRFFFIVFLLLCSLTTQAAVSLTSSTNFTAADGVRSYMDIGGVWNGLSDVSATQGDAFSFTLSNAAAATDAFKLSLNMGLSLANVNLVGNATATQTGASCVPAAGALAGFSLTQTGQTLQAVFPAAYALKAGCSLTVQYQLKALPAALPGTLQVTPSWDYANTAAGALTGVPTTIQQNILLKQGARTILLTPKTALAAVGQQSTWTITVENTGFGGLFDTSIDQSAGLLTGIILNSLVQDTVNGVARVATVDATGAILSLPYLAVGERFVATAVTTANTCGVMTEQAQTTDRTHALALADSAAITLDLKQPLLSVTAVDAVGTALPNFDHQLVFGAASTVYLKVQNLGLGTAKQVQIKTGLPTLPGVTVSAVGAGWTYNATTGVFSYTAGSLANNAVSTLSYQLSVDNTANALCDLTSVPTFDLFGRSYTVLIESAYQDLCGHAFTAPSSLGLYTLPVRPIVTLSSTPDKTRVDLSFTGNSATTPNTPGEIVVYTLSLGVTNVANIVEDPVLVRFPMPTQMVGTATVGGVPLGTTATCSGLAGACTAGTTLTWSIPKAQLAATQTMTLTTHVPSIADTPATNICPLSGTTMNSTASVTVTPKLTTVGRCDLSRTATTAVLMNNNAAGGTATVQYNIGTSVPLASKPAAAGVWTVFQDPGRDGVANNLFEIGNVDNGNSIRDVGEAEFIPIVASLGFSAAYAGTWAGSTYVDDFSGAAINEGLVAGSLVYRLDIGAVPGAWKPVPAANFNTLNGKLSLTLDFVNAGGAVANTTLYLAYKTTISNLPAPNAVNEQSLTQLGTFLIKGGNGAGACGIAADGQFTQGDFLQIAEAKTQASVSMPAAAGVSADVVEVCAPARAVQIQSWNSNEQPPQDWQQVLLMSQSTAYSYTVGSAVAAGAGLTGVAVGETIAANGDVAFTAPAATAIKGSGIMTAQLQLKANQAALVQGGLKPVIKAQQVYSTYVQHAAAQKTTLPVMSYTPSVARSAKLVLQVTPGGSGIMLPGIAPQWKIYVSNTGNGTAYAASVSDTLPTAILPNKAATDALNTVANVGVPGAPANYNAVVVGQKMTWPLGDIPAGETRVLTVVGNVPSIGQACTLGATHPVTGSWGCGGVNAETVTVQGPVYVSASGQLQALHDSTLLAPVMCSPNTPVQILVKNTGSSRVYNAVVQEILDQGVLSSGLSMILPGSVTYSTDGINYLAGVAPTGAGTTALPYTWTGVRGSATPMLAALGDLAIGQTLYIKFQIKSVDTNLVPIQMDALVSGQTVCSLAQSASPASPYTLPMSRPDIVLTQTGQNITTGLAAGSTVYAAKGDTVSWQLTVQNKGTSAAQNVQLLDQLPAANATGWTITGPGLAGAPVSSGVAQTTATIAANTTAIYTITGTLAGTCADQPNKADVTWGCAAATAGARNLVYAPSQTVSAIAGVPNPVSANLVTLPNFAGNGISQQFNALPGGRTEVVLTLTNAGAAASGLKLTDTLPAGQLIDTSFVPTIAGTSAVTMAANIANPAVPVFTLTGTVRHLQTAIITFRTKQNGSFDTTFDPLLNPETTANGLDPVLPATGLNSVSLSMNNSCAVASALTSTASFDPKTPDLDLTVTPASSMVAAGATASFTFTISNAGDVSSLADHISFTPTIGAAWATPTCKVNGTPVADCLPATINAALLPVQLASGASATVTITATAQNNGSPLTMLAEVRGGLFDNAGVATGSDYSLDQAQASVAGYSQSLILKPGQAAHLAASKLRIGEDLILTAHAQWFGSDPVSNAVLRFSLPAGYGYVSQTPTATNTITPASVVFTPSYGTVNVPGVLNVSMPTPFTPNGANNTFDVDLRLRALNVDSNTHAQTLTAPMGASFVVLTRTIASDNALDGFAGSFPLAHSEVVHTIERPQASLSIQVQNKTAAGAFGNTATGQAYDVYRYKIVLSNPLGAAPLFDIALQDSVNNLLSLVTTAGTIGADTTANGVVDVNDVAVLTPAPGQTLVFDQTTVPIPILGQNFTRLDPGKSITLYFEQTAGATVSPTQALTSHLTVTAANSLAAATAGIGVLGSFDGPALFTTAATNTVVTPITLNEPIAALDAIVHVAAVAVSESLQTTSEGNDANANVVLGEQAQMQIPLLLPAGQSPNLIVRTTLPAGLSLVARLAPVLGASVTCANNPVLITPATVPAPAAGNAAQTVTWTFGLCDVAAGTAAQRTILLDYITQVENIASNIEGTVLSDSSEQYSTDGVVFNAIASQALTVREAVSAATLSMTKINGVAANAGAIVKAGDVLSYTVSLTNAATVAAQDGTVIVTLPAGLSYKPNSTIGAGKPVAVTAEPNVTGQVLTWGNRNATTVQQIQVLAAGTNTWSFDAIVQNSVQANQLLQVQLSHDWSSLVGIGTPLVNATAQGLTGSLRGERDGITAALTLNKYKTTASVSNTVANVYSIGTAASGDTIVPPAGGLASGFRVGDLLTYTLTAHIQEGTTNAAIIEDSLPAGLKFNALTSVTKTWDGLPLTPLTQPALGATGTLQWSLGTLLDPVDANTTNDTVVLVYTARVMDVAGITTTPLTQTVSDTAILRYQDAAATAQATAPAQAAVILKQPQLSNTLALQTPAQNTLGAGALAPMTMTVSNANGVAPAYNSQLRISLPVGMRTAAPIALSASIGGTPITLPAMAYNAATGVASWNFGDALVIPQGQSLILNFSPKLDAGIGSAVPLTTSAQVTAYASQPSAQAIDRRIYAATTPASVAITSLSAATISKTSNKTLASIGDTISYTLKIPATPVNAALYAVQVSDLLPASLLKGTITTPTPPAGSLIGADTGLGNQISILIDKIDPNQQVTIQVNAIVQNIASNKSAILVSNAASFTWKKSAAAVTTEPAVNSATVTTTLQEPAMSITLGAAVLTQAVAGTLQGGDKATYTVSMQNTGTSAAFDGQIRFWADPLLGTPTVLANPNLPGAVSKGALVGGKQEWLYSLPNPLAVNAVYAFDIRFTLLNAVQPLQSLSLQAEVDWTSTLGVNVNERTAPKTVGDTLNTYRASSVTRSITVGQVSLLQTLAPITASMGETVVYTLDYRSGQNTSKQVHLFETLPAGLEFVSASIVVTSMTTGTGSPVAIISQPAAAATGLLDFFFGDLTGTAANASLSLAITARVQNTPANINAKVLNVVATAQLLNGVTPVSIPANVNPALSLTEPVMHLGFDAPATPVKFTAPAVYTLRLDNVGSSAAHQGLISVNLPVGMRGVAPSAIVLQHRGGATLVLNADYTLLYDAATGLLKIQLLNVANAAIAANAGMDISLKLGVDSSSVNGAQLAVVASIVYDSALTATTPHNRHYALTGAETVGTANGAVADDAKDDAVATVQVPSVAVIKSVNTPATTPGAVLHYQISISNTGGADMVNARLVDDMDANIVAGSLANIVVAGAVSAIVSTPTAGVNGTGQLSITGLTIAANSTATIDYDVRLQAVMASGTVVKNQATLTMTGFANPKVSDSNLPADDNGIEEGNDPALVNDDDPTLATVSSKPGFLFTKTALDVNGAALLPGDVIVYTMSISNQGNENTINSVLYDTIPAGTSYVPGSTVLNTVAIADVAGASPLLNGLTVQAGTGVGAGTGILLVGATATVSFKVTVNAGLATGVLISNQARLSTTGQGSGTLVPVLSDDPSTPNGPDPVVLPVGTGGSVYVPMTVQDVNAGASLLPGETLRYTVTPTNLSTKLLTAVTLSIPMPNAASYKAASMMFDPDGAAGPLPAVALTDLADGDAADFGLSTPGFITLKIASLPKGVFPVLTWDAVVAPTATTGTLISTQGRLSATGAAGVQTDMDGNPANGEQATSIVVGAAAVIRATHLVHDLNGGSVLPNDVLEYTISIRNLGVAALNLASVKEAIITANSTYIPGTTRLNGVLQADNLGTSPLLAGMPLGTIAAGGRVFVSYRAKVKATALVGAIIDNQASITGTDAATTLLLSVLADSPLDDGVETGNDVNNPNDDDPARLSVGGISNAATISGLVWADDNHNRVVDPIELLQTGWKVSLYSGGLLIDSRVSDAKGAYLFTGLKPGLGYKLVFTHPTTGVEYGSSVTTTIKRQQGALDGRGGIQQLRLGAGEWVPNQNLALDPSGVVYDSVTRLPLAGVVATLTGPAGFNPAIHLLAGQQGQVTAVDGFYRFDLVGTFPTGVYQIVLTPPANYLPIMPSVLLPPAVGALTPPAFPVPYPVVVSNAPPAVGSPALYYLSFQLSAAGNGVVNNHIPVDPLLNNAITIVKTTPKAIAVVGAFVPYTIQLTNNLAANMTGIDVLDVLPAGFKYVQGSAQLDGVGLEPSLTGHTLTWGNLSFAANQIRTIQLLTIVGSGVGEGLFVNTALANNRLAATQVSNTATATVQIIPDAIMSCSDVIGKVFYDHNGNGYPDVGDEGVPAARLVTPQGLLITTDGHGRYHIPCADTPKWIYGSNYLVKLDMSSVPNDYSMSSENPRVIRLSRGKVVHANFGVLQLRQMRMRMDQKSFKTQQLDLRDEWAAQLPALLDQLAEQPTRLRLIYVRQQKESRHLASSRLRKLADQLEARLADREQTSLLRFSLEVETAPSLERAP